MDKLASACGVLAVSAAVAALAAIAAAGPAAAQAAAPGSVLRARLNADIRSSEPGVNRDANSDAVVTHLVEGLVALKEDTTVGPLLAQKVEVAKDGKSYTFRLRDGLRFHNGAPLVADDVVWSWNRYLAPATQWRCLPEFDGRGITKVLAVEAPDPKTVVFKLERPSALFLATMARSDCGGAGIVHRSSVGADGKWIAPVGTGPFKLGEWKRGQYVELLRFAEYASRSEPADGLTGGKKAEVERVRFLVVPDGAAAKAALLAGQLDIVNDLDVADLGEVAGAPGIRVDKASTMSVSAILFQTRDPLLKDVRIRRAIALALDQNALVRGATNALAARNNSAIPDSSVFHGPVQAQGYTQNLAEAKKLLAQAGYQGQPIKLLANKRYGPMFDVAVLAQAMAQAAGIRLELEVLDWATQLDRYNKGTFQAMSFSYSARLDPSLNYEMFMGAKDQQPRKVWDNPEAQAQLAETMVSADKAKRQALFDALHKRMLDEVPLIVLYNGLEITAYRQSLTGYRNWAAQLQRMWNVRLQ
jgi:peptide/nickel transport system substrate-binding protein